jgi:ribose-phosphate pyrophosphokinase
VSEQLGYRIGSGGVYPDLAEQQINKELDGESNNHIVSVERRKFPAGELYVRYKESVRKQDLLLVQTFLDGENGYTVNDALMELDLMIESAKRASAGEITAVMPLFPYARQDRKAKGREPISAAWVIRMLEAAGAGRFVTVDLHSPQTQSAASGPFDHLTAQPILLKKLEEVIKGEQDRYTIVSPDAGSLKRSEDYGHKLDLPVVNIPKNRQRDDSSKLDRPDRTGGVNGRRCIIVDDMIDTAGTLCSAAKVLKESGAKSVIACATHGLFSNDAMRKILRSGIDQTIVTDTVPQTGHLKDMGGNLEVLPIAPMLAQAISKIACGESISEMFGGNNYR